MLQLVADMSVRTQQMTDRRFQLRGLPASLQLLLVLDSGTAMLSHRRPGCLEVRMW